MIIAFFKLIGRLYVLLWQIVIAILLGLTTWIFWDIYEDHQILDSFLREGKPIAVKIDSTSHKQSNWRDFISNYVYLYFNHNGKEYTSRYVMDTSYVSSGDIVRLLYHPQYDQFRQSLHQYKLRSQTNTSKLIKWSVVSTFKEENRMLFASLFITSSFILFTCGLIVKITKWTFLQYIGRFVFGALLVIGSLYLLYDSWIYYKYYNHIKENGRITKVKILETEERHYYSQKSTFRTYYYTAHVEFRNNRRLIPISKSDYHSLKPDNELEVYYEDSLNDMMSTDYSPELYHFLGVGFIILITIVFLFFKGKSWGKVSTERRVTPT